MAKRTPTIAAALAALSLLGGGCFLMPKPKPPVAPCVYLVEASAETNTVTISGGEWYAEAPVKETRTSVTFTDCYSGKPVTVHGPYVVQKIK